MFYGEYKHSIDQKGRLILPSKFREACKDHKIEKFFITRGLDRCVFMFTEAEWRVQEEKFQSMPFTKGETRTFNRMFFAGASDVIPDKQGRFLMPQFLKDYAGIEKDTVLIGVGNRIEIWDEKSWSRFYEESSSTFEQLAEHIFD